MYMRKLSLLTLLAVLSFVNGQKQEWLCNCTTKGQNNGTTTKQCCPQAPGVFVPGPPVRTYSLTSVLVLPPLVSPSLAGVDFKFLSWARRKTSSTAVLNLKEASAASRSMGPQSDGKRSAFALGIQRHQENVFELAELAPVPPTSANAAITPEFDLAP
ncbi:hypothetical protein K438DRAFT_1784664 [Mycena galopus ATCC 62051]|nr:hypothetical protein K438DRAFT_1784664 [Mycena galopus ATCC 62051]